MYFQGAVSCCSLLNCDSLNKFSFPGCLSTKLYLFLYKYSNLTCIAYVRVQGMVTSLKMITFCVVCVLRAKHWTATPTT
jgi:hypothetical protein